MFNGLTAVIHSFNSYSEYLIRCLQIIIKQIKQGTINKFNNTNLCKGGKCISYHGQNIHRFAPAVILRNRVNDVEYSAVKGR